MSPVTRDLDLDGLHLLKGAHHGSTEKFCLLEAASYMAGHTKVTDTPPCVSPILGAFGRSLNDVLPDDKRQHLKPYITALLDTADDGRDQARGLMAADWLIRVYTPTWLRLAGLTDEAASLEAMPRQATWDDVQAAVPVVRAAREKARAAGDAAWAAAGDAAWAAAWAAAGDAAWAAAGAAAGDAAWAAARDAAGDAAWAAAGAAAGAAARAAAGAAARDHLKPTVDALQDSAIALYGRMITYEPVE